MTIPAALRTDAVDRQIAMLRRMGASRAVVILPWFILATAGVLCVTAWHYAEPGFYLFAAFAVLLATLVRTGIPYIRRAIQALDASPPIDAQVLINPLPDYDSPHFEAIVGIDPRTAWRITFPQTDWTPAEGRLQAAIYYVPGVPWPSLVITSMGIIWPRSKPQRLNAARPSPS